MRSTSAKTATRKQEAASTTEILIRLFIQVAYLDLNNEVHPFTAAEAENPDFAHLIRKSGNAYTFAADGYDPYFSANISITKEIGDHVSLSFNAINFTNSRAYVKSYATGTSAIFTPNFYYGLTCRIKL